MAVPASLFIQPIVQRTQSIGGSPVKVLDAQAKFSTIDSILAINLMDTPILVSIYVSTNNFLIIPPTQIPPKSILQLIKDSYFNLITGEFLLANSDASKNLFNINVEGRLFNEVA